MKKIYTHTVFEFDKKSQKYIVNEKESQFHYVSDDTPIAQMKGGSSGGSTKTTNTTENQNTGPWGPQQQYLLDAFGQARDLFQNQMKNPDGTVAPFSPESEEAMRRTLEAARGGNPNMAGANDALRGLLGGDFYGSGGIGKDIQNNLSSTLRGDNLYGGEGFNKAVQAAMNAERPGIDSNFARAGRSGSGLAENARSQAFADAFAKQYGQERQNQLAAAGLGQQGLQAGLNARISGLGLAPDIDNMRYADINRIGNVGNMRDQMNQRRLDSRGQALDDFLKRISGNYGSTGSGSRSSSEYTPGDPKNLLMNLLGGGLAGAKIGGPWGAAGGAGLGLLSYFM